MRLYTFKQTNKDLPNWVKLAIDSFKNTMLSISNPFPCYFAKSGLEADSFRFTFINKNELKKPEDFKAALINYLNIYKKFEWPSVLIVFIQTDAEKTLENHESIFWNILQYLIYSDKKDKPIDIPENPDNYKWQFCFHGIPIFINGHSSAYKNRKSRLSHSDMMMVIQTMETLNPVAGNSKKSNLIRTNIRERVSQYDKIPVSNLLGSYPNENSHEWKQFWLPDENVDKNKCPLKFKKN